MCGVVGPNGCGKSNIIDAVRWVMGESSAKNLRGESMTDVIFKGSKARKAAGFAQVELIFDNHQGRITGEYAAYSEISVKRRLGSDSQNTYYLNGTKCRRKDIMDIFLGTGLGPRSYSIISQGMVSNLIESKPEDLRVFIEEAAGISKYKGRRRETENRIRRTKENLERLTDLREELDRRLSHLKRQAEAAEKYKSYKEEERYKRAQLCALRWRDLSTKLQKHESNIRDYEIKMEAAVSKQVSEDVQIEKLRIEKEESNDNLQLIQSRYYKAGNDITRLEQAIAHQIEKHEHLSADLQECEALKQESETQKLLDKEDLTVIEEDIQVLLPEIEIMAVSEEECSEQLLLAEEKMASWQNTWDIFNEKAGDARRNAEVAQSGIQHVEQILVRLGEQIKREQEELSGLQDLGKDDEKQYRSLLFEQEAVCESLTEQLGQSSEAVHYARHQIDDLMNQRQVLHQQLNEAQGKKSSLEALQKASLHQGENSQQWLEVNNLISAPRLAETLKVSEGWSFAVETVLGDFLQSVSIDDLNALADSLLNAEGVSLCLTDKSEKESEADSAVIKLPKLSSFVKGVDLNLLDGVFAAKTLEEALSVRQYLVAGESVVTPEGLWIGINWMRVSRESAGSIGVLDRQKALEKTCQTIDMVFCRIENIQQALSEMQQKLSDSEQLQQNFSQQLAENKQKLGEYKAQLRAEEARLEQDNSRRVRLEKSLAKHNQLLLTEQASLAEHRAVLQESLDKMENDNNEQNQLRQEQEIFREALEKSRQTLQGVKEKSHVVALSKQTLDARRQAKVQAIERIDEQNKKLDRRVKQLKDTLADNSDDATKGLQKDLNVLLEEQVAEERQMQEARQMLEAVNEKLVLLERQRSVAETDVQNIRTHLETLRMDGQSMRIRKTTLEEQLGDDHYDLTTVVSNLPKDSSENELEQTIIRLESRINQLGAINLAAIDEYDQQSERLSYLNRQNEDLEEALNTLNQAMERIDKETCERFEMTFSQINNGLKELFPRVFGGGNAYLEKIGDDLLSTGVAIMAQPPGKKNSTIHLLSGGEKALTAIALVFAIFRLNPSPFCLLDEVDAPLDDANVDRYTCMVKEMSSQVQFIYITHNKIAMEAAKQLIGVTMHEPGVSRPVSVDIEAAAEMALM